MAAVGLTAGHGGARVMESSGRLNYIILETLVGRWSRYGMPHEN